MSSIMLRDDFLNPQPVLSADGRLGMFYYDEVSAGTATYTSVAGRSIVRLSIATPASGVTNWIGSAGVQITERSLNPVLEVEMLGTADTDHRIIAGFHQIPINTQITADTNNSANEVFFRKQAARNYYECVTRSASGAENIVELQSVLTNAYHKLKIELDDGGARAIFYVDGVEVASVTQGVPASGTRLAWSVGYGVTSTVSRVLDIDSIAIQS